MPSGEAVLVFRHGTGNEAKFRIYCSACVAPSQNYNKHR